MSSLREKKFDNRSAETKYDKQPVIRRASRAVTTNQKRSKFPTTTQKQPSTPSGKTTTGAPTKTRDQLLAEWKAKKAKQAPNTPTKPTTTHTIKNTQRVATKQTYAALLKMKMKTAKDIAMRGSIRDLGIAQEKLISMVDKDPLQIVQTKANCSNPRRKQELELELCSVLENNLALFHLSEYWCTRSFIAWTIGDLESAVILLELAQQTKAQPLHPILESIQFILKKVQKDSSLLFSEPENSPYTTNTEPLIATIKRLQNFSLISCVASRKLSTLCEQLVNFVYEPNDMFSSSSSMILDSPGLVCDVQSKDEPIEPKSNVEEQQEVSEPKQVHKVEMIDADVPKEEEIVPDCSAPVECDLFEIRIKELSEIDISNHLQVSSNPKEEKISLESRLESFSDKHQEYSLADQCEQQSDMQHISDAFVSLKVDTESESESDSLEIDISGLSSSEESSDDGKQTKEEPTEDITETDSEELTENELSNSTEAPETDFNLMLTDDTTSSPRHFRELLSSSDSSSDTIQQDNQLKSPELLPNPINISDMLDMSTDPASPTFVRSRVAKAIPEPSKKTATTPGRVNTPLMKKMRQKKRSSIFQPSPSPYIRSSQPVRVNPQEFHIQMKQNIKSPESRDALALYRRESVLYKASINDMVNDLFGDEELDDDFANGIDIDIDIPSSPTPNNSPVEPSKFKVSSLGDTTPMRGVNCGGSLVPPEFIEILENHDKSKKDAMKKDEPGNKGSVVVMTPVKTTKKEQNLLDSEKKMTNVRRSVRRKASELCTPTKQDRTNMLKYCNYTYLPNERISSNEPIMVLAHTLEELSVNEPPTSKKKTQKATKIQKTNKEDVPPQTNRAPKKTQIKEPKSAKKPTRTSTRLTRKRRQTTQVGK